MVKSNHGTAISWTHFPDGYLGVPRWKGETWNTQIGCTKTKSVACSGCYAPAAIRGVAVKFRNTHPEMANRYNNVIREEPDGSWGWSGAIETFPERMVKPPRWGVPRSVFVNSLTDVFWSSTPSEEIGKMLDTINRSWPSRFLILTKRAERMRLILERQQIIPNLWAGVSIGERQYLHNLDTLRATPAAVRFLSLEPLVEDLGDLDLTGIHWVIVGGMSGPLHEQHPMDPEWAHRIQAQCKEQGVAFFFKQGSGPKAGLNVNQLGEVFHAWPDLEGVALTGGEDTT